MSETKFTPGPWEAKNEEISGVIDPIYFTITAGKGYCVHSEQNAGFALRGYMNKANADLIASAPELYEALEKSVEQMLIGLTAVQKIIMKSGTAEVLSKVEKEMMAQIRTANAALSKARGEKTDKQ